MSIKSPLCELTYDRLNEVSRSLAKLGSKYAGNGFFTVTQGIGEVTVIAAQKDKQLIQESISIKPKGQYDNLGAVTVRFVEQDYIEVPNMIYTLVSALATKRINLIELVSTYTEISFIVRQNDLNSVVDTFRERFLPI
jgi:hypothetical protein